MCLCDTIESICHIGFFLLRSGNPRFFGKPRWLDSFRFVLFFFLLDVPFPNSETRVHAAKSSNNFFSIIIIDLKRPPGNIYSASVCV